MLGDQLSRVRDYDWRINPASMYQQIEYEWGSITLTCLMHSQSLKRNCSEEDLKMDTTLFINPDYVSWLHP